MIVYKDLIDHLIDYQGADVTQPAERFARRAALNAYRDMSTGHEWSFYWQRGRVNTVAQQTTGTVAYDHTGGTYERMLTLTDNTWPTWSPYGIVMIANVTYQIDEYKSTTIITLKSDSNPGADLAAGTAYTLYRDVYPLPADFRAADEVVNNNNTGPLVYLHPREWMNAQRLHSGPATPRIYCFTGDTDSPGYMNIRLFPAPDQVYVLDFIYLRRPREMLIAEYTTGKATTAAASTTVTGSGTVWTSSMAGSTIRIASDGLKLPTGRSGGNPYLEERRIVSVESGTSLTVDAALTYTSSLFLYSISDPADVEEASMSTFLYRECEKQLRQLKRMKATPEEAQEWERAQIRAWEIDSRNLGRRAAGQSYGYPQRMANMPRGADVS